MHARVRVHAIPFLAPIRFGASGAPPPSGTGAMKLALLTIRSEKIRFSHNMGEFSARQLFLPFRKTCQGNCAGCARARARCTN